jgi:hypothetical protein
MPSKAEKLLARMRQTQTGWKRADLDSLFEGFGFVIISGRGPHDKVSHPDFPEILPTSLPRHSRVHEYIIKQAIKLIDKLEVLKRKRENENG